VADLDTRFALHVPRSTDGLARLGGWVDEVAAALALPAAAEYALRLCVEEAVTNVVMHGRPPADGDAGTVTLRVDAEADAVRLTIQDRCAAFDPLVVAPPKRPTSLTKVRVGGLGVHLMRQYSRELRYERVDGRNVLTVVISRS